MTNSLANTATWLHAQAIQLHKDAGVGLQVAKTLLDDEKQIKKIEQLVAGLNLPHGPFAPRSFIEFNQKCSTVYRPFFEKAKCLFAQMADLNGLEKRWHENHSISRSLVLVTFESLRTQTLKPIPVPLKPPKTTDGVQTESLMEYLTRNGVFGLPEDLETALAPLLARGAEKEVVRSRGLISEKGILLYGPPGTGKTTFARLLTKYVKCDPAHFTLISATSLLTAKVGGTEENIRALFQPSLDAYKTLKEKSPLYILAFDEFDSIASKKELAKNSWEVSAVNQLLTCLQGFEEQSNLLVIGITNCPDRIEGSLLRSGRLGTKIEIGLPTAENRKEILQLHLKKLMNDTFSDSSIDLDALKELTADFSGANLKGLVDHVNRVAYKRYRDAQAAKKGIEECTTQGKITMEDFKSAIEKNNWR